MKTMGNELKPCCFSSHDSQARLLAAYYGSDEVKLYFAKNV